MTAAHYVNATYVNDPQISRLVKDTHLDEVDRYINDLAASRGVSVTQIAVPLADRAMRLARAYLCVMLCRDNTGVNVQSNGYGVDVDVYKVKWGVWNREFENLEPQVTAEILTGEADTPPEFAQVGIPIYRS